MNAAVGDRELLDHVAALLGVARESLDQWLWGALLALVVLSILHLLTMLATRWGDRHSTGKALIFSVLAHLALFGGWVATAPSAPVADVPGRDQPRTVRTIITESSEPVDLPEESERPVWEKLPESLPTEVARAEPNPAEPAPAEPPQRGAEPVPERTVEFPELPNLPQETLDVPQPVEQATAGPLAKAAIPLEIDDPTAVERERIEAPAAPKTRMELVRPEQVDMSLDREATKGAIDRVAPELAPAREIASLASTVDPGQFLKRDEPSETIRTRTGPAPASTPDEATGATAVEVTDGSQGSSPVRTGPTRRPARTPDSSAIGSIERYRPERTPSLPAPQIEREVAVLERSPASRNPTPELVRSAAPSAAVQRPESSLPSVYQPRELSGRREAALEAGGTTATEEAVEKGLRWLAMSQHRDGHWDADAHGAGQVKTDSEGVDRMYAGKQADSGVTGLAVLAFLGAGYTHREGQYADSVERALGWLVRNQRSDGYLGGSATHYEQMYCHGIATYALAEAYGMEDDSRLREPLRRAVQYIMNQQNPRDGGWRYVKGQPSDMSMFGWQLMALMRAELAGRERGAEIGITETSRQLMIQFLKDRSLGTHRGLAGYRLNEPATPSMTAEAFFCKQMLGMSRTNPASLEAVEYLLQNIPKLTTFNLYYWYYATMAMRRHGGEPWEQWNQAIQDVLVAEQKRSGDEAGSWDPNGPWGPYGGRVYSTALATMCLEVYYRSAEAETAK